LRVRRECHACICATGAGDRLRYTRQAIGELAGLEPICPNSPEWYGQTAAIPLPACEAGEVKQRLWEE
jgi:hypothetical protein